jgi:hypothetical protein
VFGDRQPDLAEAMSVKRGDIVRVPFPSTSGTECRKIKAKKRI